MPHLSMKSLIPIESLDNESHKKQQSFKRHSAMDLPAGGHREYSWIGLGYHQPIHTACRPRGVHSELTTKPRRCLRATQCGNRNDERWPNQYRTAFVHRY